MPMPGPEGLLEYGKSYAERLREQFLAGMGAFAETRQPAHLAGALNPLSPIMQDAAVQAGGLIAPQVNALSQSLSQGSENLGFGPLSIPEVTDEQLAPLLMLGMGGRNKMGFYSPSGKALTTAPGKGQPGQYLAHLKKEPGATREAKETGLLQALEEAPGTLTKEEVVSMWNPIELDETVKGGKIYQYETPEQWESAIRTAEGMRMWDTAEELNREWEEQQGLSGESAKYAHEESLNLPGGSNAKEILVQLPTKPLSLADFTDRFEATNEDYQEYLENFAKGKEQSDPLAVSGPLYTGGHWSEPNVLAHIRTNERDVGGVKALHIEEIQSDWHQAGQKKGYRSSDPELLRLSELHSQQSGTRKYIGLDDAERNEFNSLWDKVYEKYGVPSEKSLAEFLVEEGGKSNIPDAPYKKDWHELAFKRALMEGINDPSIERLTWTTGDVQKERYNLAKYINSIEAQAVKKAGNASGGDNFNLAVTHKDGHAQNLRNVTPDELADHVGKEMAEKIVAGAEPPFPEWLVDAAVKGKPGQRGLSESFAREAVKGLWENPGVNDITNPNAGHYWGELTSVIDDDEIDLNSVFYDERRIAQTYSGLDLEVGGEFHKQLYDGKITKFAKKFLKKYGVEPERISDLGETTDNYEIIVDTDEEYGGNHDLWRGDEPMGSFETRKEAEDYLNKQQNIWSIDITPEMRQDLQQKGVPLTMNDKKPLLAYA